MNAFNGPDNVYSIILILICFSFLYIIWKGWRSFKNVINKTRLKSILNSMQKRSLAGKTSDLGPPVTLPSKEFIKEKLGDSKLTEDSDYIVKFIDINIILFCIQNDKFITVKFDTDERVKTELHSIFSYFSYGTSSNKKLLTAIEENDKPLVISFLDSTVDYLDFYLQRNIHPGELVTHYAAHALIETQRFSSESVFFKYYHRFFLKNSMLRTADWLCLAAFSRIPSVSEVLNQPISIKIEIEK